MSSNNIKAWEPGLAAAVHMLPLSPGQKSHQFDRQSDSVPQDPSPINEKINK